MGYKAINKAIAKKAISGQLKGYGLGFMQAGLLADRLIAKSDQIGNDRGEPGEEVLQKILGAVDGNYGGLGEFAIEVDDVAIEAEARKIYKLDDDESVTAAQSAHACLQIVARG